MAIPNTINPATPAGTDSPAQGDNEITGIKQYIVDVFGVPNNSAVTASALTIAASGVVSILRSPLTMPTQIQGAASQVLRINSQYSNMIFEINNATIMSLNATGMIMQTRFIETASGVTMVIGTRGPESLVLRSRGLDRWAVDSSGVLLAVHTGLILGSSVPPGIQRIYAAAGGGSGMLTAAGVMYKDITPQATGGSWHSPRYRLTFLPTPWRLFPSSTQRQGP